MYLKKVLDFEFIKKIYQGNQILSYLNINGNFVHGCFWHSHKDYKEGRIPSTNSKFRREKLLKNIDRDNRYIRELKDLRWKVRVIWECEIKKILMKQFQS